MMIQDKIQYIVPPLACTEDQVTLNNFMFCPRGFTVLSTDDLNTEKSPPPHILLTPSPPLEQSYPGYEHKYDPSDPAMQGYYMAQQVGQANRGVYFFLKTHLCRGS